NGGRAVYIASEAVAGPPGLPAHPEATAMSLQSFVVAADAAGRAAARTFCRLSPLVVAPPPPSPPPRLLRGPCRRLLHAQPSSRSSAVAAAAARSGTAEASNPAMAFPCLDKIENRSAHLEEEAAAAAEAWSGRGGPEPSYTSGATETYHC